MPTRRTALKTLIAAPTLLATVPGLADPIAPAQANYARKFQHAVCRWCFNDLSLDDLCLAAKKMGITAIDLVGPKDWDVLKKHGMDSSMCNGAEINLTDGWCEPKYHEQLIQNYSDMIPKVAAAGYKNLICFSGNRRGMDDLEGMRNCVKGLKQIMPLAEKHGVVIIMELFNTKKGGHLDYMCDSTLWGVGLCDMLGSQHFKLLYDIYHMQINEGNVIQNIRDYHAYFAHYHTAGVPGRHEIDDSQELYYPAIMRAIAETGFAGYVAQEFIPTAKDKLASLEQAVRICSV